MEGEFATMAPSDLVETLDRGAIAPPAGRRFSELTLRIIRPLSEDDLLDALEAGVDISGPTSLATIRHAHHRLAMLICEGKAPSAISFITGYSPGYITRLQGDPMFKELLAYYATQGEQQHVDVMERLKTLSLTAAEELQSRLETEPEKWSKTELMAVAKLGVVEAPVAAAKIGASQGNGTAAPVAVNIQFVTPEAPRLAPAGPQIEGKVERIAPEQEI